MPRRRTTSPSTASSAEKGAKPVADSAVPWSSSCSRSFMAITLSRQHLIGARPSCRRPPLGSVLGLVDDFALADPGHHAAQPGTDRLDGVFLSTAATRLQHRIARLIVEHEFARKLAGLNIVQDALHFLFGFIGDDA